MKKKRALKEKRRPDHCMGDITINDFANVELPANKGRLRKPLSCNSKMTVQPTVEVEDWEELDSNDEGLVTKKKEGVRKTKSESENREETKTYSYDVWFLISLHIRPEDVGRFAGICRTCRDTVNSASFWFNLYRRYYRPVNEMPERLRPECMAPLYGLKSRVIRALYYMYPPFASKMIHIRKSPSWDGVGLVKRRCVNLWTNWADCRWHCNILLKKENISSDRSRCIKKIHSDPLDRLDDISFNRAEGSVVLQVILKEANSVSYKNLIGASPVLGFVLTSVEYYTNSVKMTFSSSTVSTSTCDIYTINLNNVETIYTHYWWSPDYPHSIRIGS